MTGLQRISQQACFGGQLAIYCHASTATQCIMRFGVFVPPQALVRPVPVLYCLAGLTCNEETFLIKAGAQRLAAELGIMLVTPDTSPRGVTLPGDSEHWDFGVSAGFYLDATAAPWAKHYRMYSYLVRELPSLIAANFAVNSARQGICGHSMGGHGALTLGLKHPEIFKSISAFAPIVAPMQSPWGVKAFERYLGSDQATWRRYDATVLVRDILDAPMRAPILIDQGLADQFLTSQLQPHLFETACREAGYPLTLRRHSDYEHGYYFITSFIDDHLRHHAAILAK